jgi:hypothetical protein
LLQGARKGYFRVIMQCTECWNIWAWVLLHHNTNKFKFKLYPCPSCTYLTFFDVICLISGSSVHAGALYFNTEILQKMWIVLII